MQAVVTLLDLDAETYRARDGQAVAAPTRTPTSADVRWQLGGQFACRGVAFGSRATLPLGATGGYSVTEAGARSIRTPRLVASGIRSWLGLELYDDAPAGTSVTYRLRTGGVEYYWTGAAWATASTASHWASRAATVANVASLTAAGRDLAVVARLATTDPLVAPTFYGAAVAAGVREVGDLDDALIRAVLASLRESVTLTTVVELEAPSGGLASVRLSGASAEFQLDLASVEAAYNVTDDAGEASPLSGSLSGGVWTPATPLAATKVLRLYVVARPRIVARSHRDAEQLDALPAVYLSPSTTPRSWRGQEAAVVRDVDAGSGLELASPIYTEQPVGVRVIAELGSDAQRLVRALAAWLGGAGHRVLVSPVSGRLVEVRAVDAPFESSGTLAQGVVETRLSWSVSYRAERADILRAVDLVRVGGLAVSLNLGS